MDKHYRTLGLSPDATTQQVRNAYVKLAQEYNPDRYTDSAKKKWAQERMDEINTAFDAIMNYSRTGNAPQPENTNSASGNDRDDFYIYIRRLIQQGKYDTALNQLKRYVNEDDAEWQFLMGSAMYYSGYYSSSFEYFRRAAEKEPSNREYTATYNRMNSSRNGNVYSSPYSQQETYQFGGMCCDPCTVCQCLICMDCCCR